MTEHANEHEPWRHRFDATAFVWGAIFIVLAAFAFAGRALVIPELNPAWLLAAVLVILGVAGLIRAVGQRR